MKELRVSIIIPTINRYNDLEKTIESLLRQNFKGFEIIIIDQTDPNDLKIRQKFESSSNICFISSTIKSASAARNIGIKQSKGEVLIFLDDDVIINDVNFINKHFRHYSDPKIPGVFGCPLELSGNQKKRYIAGIG